MLSSRGSRDHPRRHSNGSAYSHGRSSLFSAAQGEAGAPAALLVIADEAGDESSILQALVTPVRGLERAAAAEMLRCQPKL